MASLNKVILCGNLGKDPETRYTQSGDAVTNFSIATSEKWTDKSGEKKEQTQWHNIVMFGRIAEVAGEYLKKGSSCLIVGKLQTRKWQDKEGNDRYTTEIVANELQLLGGKPEESERPAKREKPSAKPSTTKTVRKPDADMDDDIPF